MSIKNRSNLSDFRNIKLPILQLFNLIFQRFNLSVLIKNNIVLVVEIFNIIIIKNHTNTKFITEIIPIITVKIKCRIYQSRWEKNFILVFSFFFMITPYKKELVLTLYFLLYQNISSSVRHVDRITILHPSRKPSTKIE